MSKTMKDKKKREEEGSGSYLSSGDVVGSDFDGHKQGRLRLQWEKESLMLTGGGLALMWAALGEGGGNL